MPGPVQGVLERAGLGRDTWVMSVAEEQALSEGSLDEEPPWFPSMGSTWGHLKVNVRLHPRQISSVAGEGAGNF